VAHITVLSFEDSVRERTGMYFAVAPKGPDLPMNIVRGVIDDALHSARASAHQTVEIEVAGDLRFTVANDQPAALDERGEPSRASMDQ
jgi:DNA gyrase/topoisomerase IV subunit B